MKLNSCQLRTAEPAREDLQNYDPILMCRILVNVNCSQKTCVIVVALARIHVGRGGGGASVPPPGSQNR